MTKHGVYGACAVFLLLLAGWGCEKIDDSSQAPSAVSVTESSDGQVLGDSDVIPDGKGAAPVELCVSTKAPVTGEVWLYGANNAAPRMDWTQWFSAKPVAVASSEKEICGAPAFSLETGDTVFVNGSWQSGKKSLVYRASDGSPANAIKEIWIDDQYYEVGKDCAYVENGNKGYNLACTIR